MDRREFLTALLSGAALAGFAPAPTPARADEPSPPDAAKPQRLAIVDRTIEVNGKSAKVFGLVRPDGGPGLALDAGSAFDIELTNNASEPSLIHWHGLTPPWPMDGVPDNPAPMLKPGEARRYAFLAGDGGTHWMHAHTLQEQRLLAAPLIVRTEEDRGRDEQEVVILLHDFTFKSPEEVLAGLKGGKAAMPMNHGAMMNHMMDGPMAGMMAKRMPMMKGGGMPGMGMMDVNDVDFDAYLANDRTLDDPEVVRVDRGGKVRLRIINGATATAYTIDLGAAIGELVAVDGQPVIPVKGSRFPLAMGQRLDVRLQSPPAGGALPILALREGARERTGIVLAAPGATVAKLRTKGDAAGPTVGLDLETLLRAARPLTTRRADRRVALILTGGMDGYNWAIAGDLPRVKAGERIEVTMRNMSMMSHPMHLHGHHFQVVAIDGAPIAGAMRDTVMLPHMAAVTVAFDAANPGKWPLHCHQLYHMASGMMTFVAYEGAA